MQLDAGFTEENWNSIRDAAREAFAASAQVSAILERGPDACDPYHVTVPRVVKSGTRLELDTTKSAIPIHLWIEWNVKSSQLSDVPNIRRLARTAGQRLALAESKLLYAGYRPIDGDSANDHWFNKDVTKFLADLAVSTDPKLEGTYTLDGLIRSNDGWRHSVDATTNADFGRRLLDAVEKGVNRLVAAGYGPPFGLVARTTAWSHVRADVRDREQRRLFGLLGDDSRLALAPQPEPSEVAGHFDAFAALFSIPAAPVDLVRVEPVDVGIVAYENGGLVMRAEERFLLRVAESDAIVNVRVSKT